jgi:hypothetical protein
MKKLFKLRTIVLIVVTMLISQGGQSQISWDDDAQQQDAMVPLDGGLSILLGVGVAYGIKKVRNRKK